MDPQTPTTRQPAIYKHNRAARYLLNNPKKKKKNFFFENLQNGFHHPINDSIVQP